MGNETARCCTSRECCGDGGVVGSMYDGKTLWTLEGIVQLPDGVCCLYLSGDGDDPLASTSQSLRDMMRTLDRITVYRKLCGRIFTFGGIGSTPDPEEVLLEFAPDFERNGIDLYLTRRQDEEQTVNPGRWLIFVDRFRNKEYVPANSYKPLKKKSAMKRFLAGGATYELVDTSARADAPPAAEEPQRIDFSGVWKEMNYEGDMKAYLKEKGFSEEQLQVAATLNYGVGAQFQEIDHQGNTIVCTIRLPRGSITNEFVVNDSMQNMRSNDGAEMTCRMSWSDDGDAILTKEYKDGKHIANHKRYLRLQPGKAKEMVIESSVPGSRKAIKRIYNFDEQAASNGASGTTPRGP